MHSLLVYIIIITFSEVISVKIVSSATDFGKGSSYRKPLSIVKKPRSKMPVYIVPEAKQRIGVWGAPTSTLDWCEENHIVTSFIAELCKLCLHVYTCL